MAISTLLVRTYAQNVFLAGTNRLTARDGFSGVRDGYYIPTQQYAAKTYFIDDLDSALAKGWISPEEHAETLGYKTDADPKYRPDTTLADPTVAAV